MMVYKLSDQVWEWCIVYRVVVLLSENKDIFSLSWNLTKLQATEEKSGP